MMWQNLKAKRKGDFTHENNQGMLSIEDPITKKNVWYFNFIFKI